MSLKNDLCTRQNDCSDSGIVSFLLARVSLTALGLGCLLLFAIRFVFHQVRIYRLSYQNGCLPPKSFPLWDKVFGLDHLFELNRALKEHKLLALQLSNFRKYGNTFFRKSMGRNFIATIEPENVKTILATQFEDFGLGNARANRLTPLLGHGIFTTDGERWERSRALVRPNFVRQQVADLHTFDRHVTRLLKLIPQDETPVDLQNLFFKLTMDSATEFLFGESVMSLTTGEGSANFFAKAFGRAQDLMIYRIRLGAFMNFFPATEMYEECGKVHAYVGQFVDKALEQRKLSLEKGTVDNKTDERYVFLRELAKVTDDPIELRDQLLNILLAGRDTTAGLLSNIFFTLSKRPDIWNKLKAEIDKTQGEAPTFESLKDLKYLRYVINEGLRLFPSVPTNSRMAFQDTTLPVGGGPDGKAKVFVPKGTAVAFPAYSLHRRKDFYGEDADEFRPERWETLRPGWEYLPFNGGPRICLGQQFALTETSYTIVRIVQHFDKIHSCDPRPWSEGIGLTLFSQNGCLVSLEPRK
jgi:cytochrome P450